MNLQKYQDKEVRVKFQGGREGEFDAWICLMLRIWSVCYWVEDGSVSKKYDQVWCNKHEDGQADGGGASSWRSGRIGRAAQNDRARWTGSICGSEAEEQQIGPEREMQQEEERLHRLEATSWRTPLATVQVDSLRFEQLPYRSRSAYGVSRSSAWETR